MPYACWFLWLADYIEDFKWHLDFQFGVAFWRVVLREVYLETFIEDFNLEHSGAHDPWEFSQGPNLNIKIDVWIRKPSTSFHELKFSCGIIELYPKKKGIQKNPISFQNGHIFTETSSSSSRDVISIRWHPVGGVRCLMTSGALALCAYKGRSRILCESYHTSSNMESLQSNLE